MSDTPRTDKHEEQMEVEDLDVECSETYHLARDLERELNATKAVKRCDWKQDADGNWDTSCNQCMCFEYAPPFEQGYKFCHHCGHTINFIKYEDKQP